MGKRLHGMCARSSVLIIIVMMCMVVSGCQPTAQHDQVSGPPDCHGTSTTMGYIYDSFVPIRSNAYAHVRFVCDKQPYLFTLSVILQYRLKGQKNWRLGASGSYSGGSRFQHQDFILGKEYHVFAHLRCLDGFSAFFRMIQTFSGDNEKNVPFATQTVYFPDKDKGRFLVCGTQSTS